MKFLREPLVHFLAIGAAIFVLYALYGQQDAQEQERTLTITAGEISWLNDAWEKRWNRPPTPEEHKGIVDQYIREMIVYRQARVMGLDQQDSIIRRRLVQKLENFTKDLASLTPPTEEELKTYFSAHQDRYQQPARYTFTQVFIDPDKRGDATLVDAEKIKEALIAQGTAFDSAGALGDTFMLKNYYTENSPIEIQKHFGSGFTNSLLTLEPGQWHGPVLSGYGVHLVYVSHVSEAPKPVFAAVRERVTQDWKADKEEELSEKFYESVRDRAIVVIESPPEDGTSALPNE